MKALLVCTLAVVASASERCTLSLFDKRDYWDWRYFGTGLYAALYDSPAQDYNDCDACVEFGSAVGAVQSALYTIEF